MNTKTLEKFAQTARRQLHEQVAARLARVLSTDSAELRAKARTIAALEREIQRTSRQSVVERVAYTWFNRFCALRYMDANRYTRVGTVSPAAGYTQPEILQEAKQGHIDGRLERFVKREMVLGLLDGSRPSSDPQQEAHRLLLVAVCNSYHQPMPFLFEPIDDYSELLMPEDLLSEGSILQGVREALTAEACRDVEVIGWLYQFYISEKKDEVIKSKKKIQADEIPAATQLFTPHWIVRYLVENSLGRLWMLNNPNSRLAERMDYYIKPEQEETDFLVVNSPEELRIADPAAGSGHMLTYAFDLLYAIYEEEGYNAVDIPRLILKKNLYGMEIDERAGALAAFALMMKGREKDRRFLRRGVLPNICVLKPVHFEEGELAREPWVKGLEGDQKERLLHDLHLFREADNFGSLLRPQLKLKEIAAIRERIVGNVGKGQLDWLEGDRQKRVLRALDQAAYMARKHHVVVANPPYMGSGNMNATLKRLLKTEYRYFKSDLFAAFAIRIMEMTKVGSFLGIMVPFNWMFLSSFERLRRTIFKQSTITNLVRPEFHAFFDSAYVSVCGFTLFTRPMPEFEGSFIDLDNFYGADVQPVKALEAIANPECGWFYRASTVDFKKIPGMPIAYWVSNQTRMVYAEGELIGDFCDVSEGVKTGRNSRFLRYWWEVQNSDFGLGVNPDNVRTLSKRKRWFPHHKGGDYRRWYGNLEYVINWKDNGREIKDFPSSGLQGRQNYFRSGITWSKLSSSYFGVRYLPEGTLFDSGSPGVFPSSGALLMPVLAFLESKVSSHLIEMLNPTLNFQVGNVSALPFVKDSGLQISNGPEKCIEMTRRDWDSYETSWDFESNALLGGDTDDRTRLPRVADAYATLRLQWKTLASEMVKLEEENNRIFINTYSLLTELRPEVSLEEITLFCNPYHRYGSSRLKKRNWDSFCQQFPGMSNQMAEIAAEMAPDMLEEERLGLEQRLLDDTMREFISYAVGCMFGRYSLDKPGLILANQGETIDDYLRQVPEPTFMPDKDNVIPMLDGDWFPDDISERFRKFLRVTFGEEHYEENLAFVEAAIGRDIRSYFLRDFYDHHLKMYSKRPIYWLFSSAKGSFNALIYMHRYRPHTVSVVLNDYLREFRTKLAARRRHLEQVSISGASSQRDKTQALKEMDGIAKVLNELREYEDEVLYPLATEQVAIDLDDGVAVNYGKFGRALKVVKGLS